MEEDVNMTVASSHILLEEETVSENESVASEYEFELENNAASSKNESILSEIERDSYEIVGGLCQKKKRQTF